MDQRPPGPYGSPGSQQPLGPQPRQMSAAKIISLTLLVAIAVVGLGAIFVYNALQNIGGRAPSAVSAPVVYSTQIATLTADEPIVHGRFAVEGTESREGNLNFGLTAGVPIASAKTIGGNPTVDPAAILAGPVIRIRATQGNYTVGCIAPCELPLPTYNCSTPSCRVDLDVAVELLSPRDGLASPVTVTIAGVASTRLGEHLPEGTHVDFALDGAASDP
jgi:hypothetical protein